MTKKAMEGEIKMKKSKLKQLLPMRLQFFGGEPTDPVDPHKDPVDPKNPEDPKPPELKYTDDDVDQIVNQKFAKWQKDQEAKQEEAAKLAEMNAEEKAQHAKEKLEEENTKLKKDIAFNELSKEAVKMFSEHSIVANDELTKLVVKDTAEETKTCVENLVTLIHSQAEKISNEKLKGTPPKISTDGTGELSWRDKIAKNYNNAKK